jgi:hypothetical protein
MNDCQITFSVREDSTAYLIAGWIKEYCKNEQSPFLHDDMKKYFPEYRLFLEKKNLHGREHNDRASTRNRAKIIPLCRR